MRKNIKDYTQMQIRRSTLKQLNDFKVHKNQSYEEVIKELIDEAILSSAKTSQKSQIEVGGVGGNAPVPDPTIQSGEVKEK